MLGIEVALAFFSNFRGVLALVAVFTGLVVGGLLIAVLVFTNEQSEADPEGRYFNECGRKIALYRGLLGRFAVIAVITSTLACFPNVNDLWAARIGMLKFSLASPENAEKVIQHTGEIVKELECRYLQVNCPAAPEKE